MIRTQAVVLDVSANNGLYAASNALDVWIEGTGDLGLVLPEREMVESRLWPEGQQPRTATATTMATFATTACCRPTPTRRTATGTATSTTYERG